MINCCVDLERQSGRDILKALPMAITEDVLIKKVINIKTQQTTV